MPVLMKNKPNQTKLTMKKKGILVMKERMMRKAQDSKNNREPKIQRNLLTLICQMTCSLMRKETREPMVSHVSFVFSDLLLGTPRIAAINYY